MGKKTVGLGVAGAVLALGALAAAALYRPDIPFEKLEAKYATPTSHFVDLGDGVRIHYRDDGPREAAVVLLIHGFGDSFLTWEPWINRLSPAFRVITLDLPGHGLTRTPPGYAPSVDVFTDTVDRFAGKLGLPPAAVVGNSMGGGVAWQLALRYPERVRALILLDAAGWPPRPGKPQPVAFRLLQTPAGQFALKTFETRPLTAQGLRMNVVDDSLITPAFVDRWVEVQRAPGHRDILMGMRPGAHSTATPEALAKITAPTLVMHGAQDVVIEPSAGEKFAAAIPGARLILYPKAGHLPQYEIPDETTADLKAFLASLPDTEAQAGN